MPSIDPNDLVQKTKRRLEEIRGDTLKEALELKKRARTFEKYRNAVIKEVKGRREKNARAPVSYDGSEFDADGESQQKIQGAIQRAKRYNTQSNTWQTKWKLADNTFRTVTQSDLEAVFDLIAAQVEAAYNREAELVQEIGSASTIDELKAIDVESHWP